MKSRPLPAREVGLGVLLLGLLVAAVCLAPRRPGPGPLALCTLTALIHAALLVPALNGGKGLWAFLPLPLALPALVTMSYGHPQSSALLGSAALLALACAGGWAGRSLAGGPGGRLYLPTTLLIFLAPYGMYYLVAEFGTPARAAAWLRLSPLAAAGGWPPAPCLLLLCAWPVWALASKAR